MRKYWRQFFYCHKSEFSSYFIKKKRRGAAVKERMYGKELEREKTLQVDGAMPDSMYSGK